VKESPIQTGKIPFLSEGSAVRRGGSLLDDESDQDSKEEIRQRERRGNFSIHPREGRPSGGEKTVTSGEATGDGQDPRRKNLTPERET